MPYVIYDTWGGMSEWYFVSDQSDYMLVYKANSSDCYTSLAFWLGANAEDVGR